MFLVSAPLTHPNAVFWGGWDLAYGACFGSLCCTAHCVQVFIREFPVNLSVDMPIQACSCKASSNFHHGSWSDMVLASRRGVSGLVHLKSSGACQFYSWRFGPQLLIGGCPGLFKVLDLVGWPGLDQLAQGTDVMYHNLVCGVNVFVAVQIIGAVK